MKKIMAILTAVMLVFGSNSINSSADEILNKAPDDYIGYLEEISLHSYILQMKDFSTPATNLYNELYDDSQGQNIFNIEKPDEIEIGFDTRTNGDYSDDTFVNYKTVEENTGYYMVTGQEIQKILDYTEKYDEIEEIYVAYEVVRNGMADEYTTGSLLGYGYLKVYNYDDILIGDVDDNGKVEAQDALKILNIMVGNDDFKSIKEKIQSISGVRSWCYLDSSLYEKTNSVKYNNLTAEDALDILQKVVKNC